MLTIAAVGGASGRHTPVLRPKLLNQDCARSADTALDRADLTPELHRRFFVGVTLRAD